MRKICSFFIFFACIYTAQGQSLSNGILVGKIDVDNSISRSNQELLRDLLQNQLGKINNGTTFGSLFCNAFLSQVNQGEISGMAKKKVFKYALDLKFYDIVLNEEYHTATFNLSGSGSNKEQAIKACIQSLRRKKKELASTKEKVWQIQASTLKSCDKINRKLSELQELKQYTSILALTNTINLDHPCYNSMASYRKEAYQAQQLASCNQAIRNAKASLAVNDFEKVKRIITQVDPKLECATEIDELIKEMSQKFSDQQMEVMEWYIKYKSDEMDMQKAQMNIISNLILKELIHAH